MNKIREVNRKLVNSDGERTSASTEMVTSESDVSSSEKRSESLCVNIIAFSNVDLDAADVEENLIDDVDDDYSDSDSDDDDDDNADDDDEDDEGKSCDSGNALRNRNGQNLIELKENSRIGRGSSDASTDKDDDSHVSRGFEIKVVSSNNVAVMDKVENPSPASGDNPDEESVGDDEKSLFAKNSRKSVAVNYTEVDTRQRDEQMVDNRSLRSNHGEMSLDEERTRMLEDELEATMSQLRGAETQAAVLQQKEADVKAANEQRVQAASERQKAIQQNLRDEMERKMAAESLISVALAAESKRLCAEEEIRLEEGRKVREVEERVLQEDLVREREREELRNIEEVNQRVLDIEHARLQVIEDERLLRLKICKDSDLAHRSSLTPLKRMTLDLDKKKQSRYERTLMEQKEKKAREEEELRLKAEEGKKKYEETKAAQTALMLMRGESEKKMQIAYERALVEEKEEMIQDKIQNKNERRRRGEEARQRNTEVENAKRQEASRKMQELLDTNKRVSQNWKASEDANTENEWRARILGGIRVQDDIKASINMEIERQERLDASQRLAVEKERRMHLDTDRRLTLDSERKVREAEERRARAEMEYNARTVSMAKRAEDYARRVAEDDARMDRARQEVLDRQENDRKMREVTYRQNERQLQAEYKLKNEHALELYMLQDSERRGRVDADRKRLTIEEFKASAEYARVTSELNQTATAREAERKSRQQTALNNYLEDERRIDLDNVRKADEAAKRRAEMESRRLSLIQTERTNYIDLQMRIALDHEKKTVFEFDRKARDDNASRLRFEYERSIKEDLEAKRIEKAERKLKEENQRNIEIEYQRMKRVAFCGVADHV